MFEFFKYRTKLKRQQIIAAYLWKKKKTFLSRGCHHFFQAKTNNSGRRHVIASKGIFSTDILSIEPTNVLSNTFTNSFNSQFIYLLACVLTNWTY
jgi:hypothetical protein